MVLYDDLFNMRRQFYEESKRRWEEETKLKMNVCPQCGSSDLDIWKQKLWCRKCGFFPIISND